MNTPALELYRHGPTRAFLIGDLLLYHDLGQEQPAPDPWSRYLAVIESKLTSIERCLIVPGTGGLSAHQREQTRRSIGSRPTAVLTSSAVDRGIITSLTWFGVPIRAFRAGEYRAALLWLDREPLLAEVERLCRP